MRLSILYLTTCVGLQYGSLLLMLRSFSWKHGINHFLIYKINRHQISSYRIPDLPKIQVYILKQGQPAP